MVDVQGETRDLIAAVPEGYSPEQAHRLVLAFHGRTNPPERVRRYYGLEGADEGRTLFVYPRAVRQADGTFTWRLPEDLFLVEAVVNRFAAEYCLALDSVYAVGHSLGASFVNSLACARGDLLRGVATVAGGITPTECSGETAALLLHNPEDRLVPLDQGRRALMVLLDQNALPKESAARVSGPFVCQRYGTEETRNPVLWCLYGQSTTARGRYYPHQWPEGAEEAVMDFFDRLDE